MNSFPSNDDLSIHPEQVPTFRLADESDLACLIPLCERYHVFEELSISASHRERALRELLQNRTFGVVLICRLSSRAVGYIALCFGYSIELNGREAFVDELFVDEEYRGRGIGSLLLDTAIDFLQENKIAALHLEVARENSAAIELYGKRGFVPRARYFLMTKQFHIK